MNQTTNPPQPAANAKSEGPTHRIDLRTAAGAVCPIVIAPGLRHEVGQWVCRQLSAKRALVVVDTRIAVSHGGDVMKSIRDAGIEVRQVESIAAESKKTLDGAKGLYAAMAEFRLERAEPVIAVGGGVVGDTMRAPC
jgi:3-dehydroquinate synthase